jgi:hypothetical protein
MNPPRILRVLAFCRAAIVLGMTGIVGTAAERESAPRKPDIQPWKPAIGEPYRWTDPAGEEWNAVDIANSQGNAKVTFLSRQAPVEPGNERFRAILFSEGKKVLPLPYNVGRGRDDKIDVYWYEPIGEEGPFVRFVDRWGEYLVDLRRKTTALMVRRKGMTFVGELRPGEDEKASPGISDYGTRIEVSVAGRPTMVVIGPLAKEPGNKVGEISDK